MPAADLAIEWMDYDTLARRFGIERESARQKAKRGRWARRRDNAGGWQVGVPVEVLQEHPVRDHATGDRDHDRVQDDANAEMNADVIAFTRHIERLEQALEAAQVRATDCNSSSTLPAMRRRRRRRQGRRLPHKSKP